MSAAIYYHPEAYTTSGPKLMGRNAAGESFMRGFLQHSRAERFAVQVMERAHAQSFADVARSLDRKEPITVVDKSTLGSLRGHGVVYHPGPGLADHARQRSFWGHEAWRVLSDECELVSVCRVSAAFMRADAAPLGKSGGAVKLEI